MNSEKALGFFSGELRVLLLEKKKLFLGIQKLSSSDT
jgi:hypothetical protein